MRAKHLTYQRECRSFSIYILELEHLIISPIYTRTCYHGRTKIYTGITPVLCSDTRNITQRLVRLDRTNLGRPLGIPHFCLHLKLLRRSKLVCKLHEHVILTDDQDKFVQPCPG